MDFPKFESALQEVAFKQPFSLFFDDATDSSNYYLYESTATNRPVFVVNTTGYDHAGPLNDNLSWISVNLEKTVPLEWFYQQLVQGKNSHTKALILFGVRECHMLNHLGIKKISFVKSQSLMTTPDLDELLKSSVTDLKLEDGDIMILSLGEYTNAAIVRLSILYPKCSFVDYFNPYKNPNLPIWKASQPRIHLELKDGLERSSIIHTESFREDLRRFFTENISRSVTINDVSGYSLYSILKGNGYHLPKKDNPQIIDIGVLERSNISGLKSKAKADKSYNYAFICLDKGLEESWWEEVPRTFINKMNNFSLISNFQALPRVTFVLPTTGRRTINKAIDSISNQNPYRYYPIMILSDLEPANGQELGRTSGITRNKALELIKSGWVGFLDDDDELSPGAIDKLYPYMGDYDIIVPRALYNDGQLAWTEPKMIGGNVGIWFFYNKSRFPDHRFPLGFYEDFRFIQSMEFDKARIKFIDEVTYIIRPSAN